MLDPSNKSKLTQNFLISLNSNKLPLQSPQYQRDQACHFGIFFLLNWFSFFVYKINKVKRSKTFKIRKEINSTFFFLDQFFCISFFLNIYAVKHNHVCRSHAKLLCILTSWNFLLVDWEVFVGFGLRLMYTFWETYWKEIDGENMRKI